MYVTQMKNNNILYVHLKHIHTHSIKSTVRTISKLTNASVSLYRFFQTKYEIATLKLNFHWPENKKTYQKSIFQKKESIDIRLVSTVDTISLKLEGTLRFYMFLDRHRPSYIFVQITSIEKTFDRKLHLTKNTIERMHIRKTNK